MIRLTANSLLVRRDFYAPYPNHLFGRSSKHSFRNSTGGGRDRKFARNVKQAKTQLSAICCAQCDASHSHVFSFNTQNCFRTLSHFIEGQFLFWNFSGCSIMSRKQVVDPESKNTLIQSAASNSRETVLQPALDLYGPVLVIKDNGVLSTAKVKDMLDDTVRQALPPITWPPQLSNKSKRKKTSGITIIKTRMATADDEGETEALKAKILDANKLRILALCVGVRSHLCWAYSATAHRPLGQEVVGPLEDGPKLKYFLFLCQALNAKTEALNDRIDVLGAKIDVL
ncbi:hypothetical protein N7520_005800 [Penicillium odoratum]|uniref:uncharacterized protein n=1 Tax=Penicillium odoratum TaxID=1167516 RepID=UPI002547AC73|nr:uncharacterized protein N7520_005800 [Penicillium odoratum]KAJ5758644.1 hypothetical protein N7520_005800 [Penicillium odoratum]